MYVNLVARKVHRYKGIIRRFKMLSRKKIVQLYLCMMIKISRECLKLDLRTIAQYTRSNGWKRWALRGIVLWIQSVWNHALLNKDEFYICVWIAALRKSKHRNRIVCLRNQAQNARKNRGNGGKINFFCSFVAGIYVHFAKDHYYKWKIIVVSVPGSFIANRKNSQAPRDKLNIIFDVALCMLLIS